MLKLKDSRPILGDVATDAAATVEANIVSV
jgi:hypothetical protein